MLRNYFKVTEDFSAPLCTEGGLKSTDTVHVEKGDIIVDVKPFDRESLVGKTLVSQKMIRIPKHCVEELKDENDDAPNSDYDSRSSAELGCGKRKSGDLRKELNRNSRDSKQFEGRVKSGNEVPMSNSKTVSGEEEGTKIEARDEYIPIKPQIGAASHPKAPPRIKKRRNMNGETSGSRESDEGYNSCSHYSGDKPPEQEHVARSSYYNTPIGTDIPLLTSFGESPHRISSPRPSIQDSDGYEIPSFVGSVPSEEVATDEEKGITLKFFYQRKSSNLDDTFTGSSPLNGKFHLSSIGEHSESIYETWDAELKVRNSADEKKKARRDRTLVLLYFGISLIASISAFFVLLFVSETAPLLCFTASVNLFAIIFVGFLTMGKRRWLCIASLLAPGLFSKKVKVGLCLTLCTLIVSGPVCNLMSNVKLVFNCQNFAHNGSESGRGSRMVAQEIPRAFATDALNVTVKDVRPILKQCDSALRDAIKLARVHGKCNGPDTACVIKSFEPHFGRLCKNLSEASRFKKWSAEDSASKSVIKVSGPVFTFRIYLLQLLPLLLLLILHEAYWYNRGYLSNKEMDNVYITGKLKALDHERKERGMKNILFPLRKLEFRTYVLPSSLLQTSPEVKEVLRWVVVWTSLALAVLLSIFLDKYMNQVLSFLAINTLSNCDIEFTTLDGNVFYSICIILALLIIVVGFQSYALRSRSRICSYFYPKKESARGVHLYHKILRDRAAFWKACKERGKMMSESRRTRWKIGIGHRLFRAMPKIARSFLTKLFVYRCMICNSLTFRKSFICKDEGCFATFCYECYIDMGQTCISCRPGGVRDSVFTSV